MATNEEIKGKIKRALLKRPQSALELCERIGRGYHARMLSRPLAQLAQESPPEVIIHPGRPTRYAKP